MSDTLDLANKIVELRLALRRVCMCEDGDKALLSLKTKALFVIGMGDKVSPSQLMSSLRILKPNLTTLAKELEDDGLIIRSRMASDRRAVCYSITDKGRAHLDERLIRIGTVVETAVETPKDLERVLINIDEVLSFLSFVSIS